MTKTRTFIAVNLPKELKQKLGNLAENLKKETKAGVKWVNPENFHLTLHFLGWLEDEETEKVKNILKNVVLPDEIYLKIKEIDCFPGQNSPRVLFFKCQEQEGNYLINLQKAIGQELEKAGFEPDKRPWQIHLTFGRVKLFSKDKNTFAFLKRNGLLPAEELKFKVKSIDLMKSDLRITGPIYTVLNSYPLK